MKGILTLTLVVIVLGLTALLSLGIAGKMHKTNIAKEKIITLPSFSFKTINDTIYSSDQIKEGPVLILFFHPECEHCQFQITSLFRNWAQLRDVHLLLISNADKNEVRSFIRKNKFPDCPGLIVLIDEANTFMDYFGTEQVPATFIYNKKLKLVKYFQGEVRPETILKYLISND